MSGEDILKCQEQLNGFRLQKVIGRDVDNRLVFRAVNYRRQKISIKVIPIHDEIFDFVFNQALFCCEINHPCIASSHQFSIRKRNSQLILFMEHFEGNLGNDLKKIRDEDLGACARNITDGLFHIHDILSITHCDLRPQSVQLSPTTPKVSFYSAQLPEEVHSECYLPPEFSGKHTKQGDMWALGLLLVELFSKMRLTEIMSQLRNKKKPIHQFRKFNPTQIMKHVKFLKVKPLIRDLLNNNPQARPKINQFYIQLLSVVNSSDFRVNQGHQIFDTFQNRVQRQKQRQRQRQKQKQRLIRLQLQRKSKQRQKQVQNDKKKSFIADAIERCSFEKSKAQNQVFRLQSIRDRSKLKILNLCDMKIVKIEQIYDVPNLEWLYLQNNLIVKIENLDYSNLKGLNLGNNKIIRIQNLDQLISLEELYLHNNLLEKMENLDSLKSLKWLYLNQNKIKQIDNIWELKFLKTIALKNNPIDRFQGINISAMTKFKSMNIECYLQQPE